MPEFEPQYTEDPSDAETLTIPAATRTVILGRLRTPAISEEEKALQQLTQDIANRMTWAAEARRRRRRLRTSLILFVLTFLSTTLVGADYWPLDILPGYFNDAYRVRILNHLNQLWPNPDRVMTLTDRFWQSIQRGCQYSIPLMVILFCHEMGHFLQAVRYRVPASFPYFIPLPLPPLGTMGAVILQGRGVADRKKMFDIAVSGPIAGLVVTLPVLYFGIQSSGYAFPTSTDVFVFGQPVLVRWLIEVIHGPAPAGMIFAWNGIATAGWVGVFITAMNLLPVGQLDGGHIMYTLIGRPAHYIAWGLILIAVAVMLRTGMYSYILLLVLLTLTGPRHPPTADDTVPLGRARHVTGWVTLAFLLIGFTPQPIVIPDNRPAQADYEDVIPPFSVDSFEVN
ncbi:MAG: site-2 protease family protein [Planctomycetaceae bacterium]